MSEECSECEKTFDRLAETIDPWGKSHGDSGMCQTCYDNYDPTPYAYDSEPPITDKERHSQAWEIKRGYR